MPMELILNSLLSSPLQHRAGLRFTELGRSCSQISVNPTALFLSYLTVIKLVDLGFSSVMIFSSLLPIYLDHHIALHSIIIVKSTIFTRQEVYIMAPFNGHISAAIYLRPCVCLGCLPQCCYITYHT